MLRWPMGRVQEVGTFLGLNRNVGLLLGAIVLIGAAEETWVRFVPKYLEALGASVAVIGLYDALKTLLGALYAYPGGILADQWGVRRALVTFTALSLVGYVVVLLVPAPIGVLTGMFLFLSWSGFSLPATFSLVAQSLPPGKHAMGIGIQSLVKRIPIVIGPIVGGLLLDKLGVVRGTRAGVAIAVVLGSAALVVQGRFSSDSPATMGRPLHLRNTLRILPRGLRHLLISDILVRFCERIPFAWVVIYAMDHVGVSAFEVGLLVAIEMGVAMLFFVPSAALADRYGKEPFVIATFLFFTLFPLTLLFARNFRRLVIAFVVRGLKEFGEPARKALIIQLSPQERRAETIGSYYLLRDVAVTAGSLVGSFLWSIGPEANFLSACALGAAGTVVYWLVAKDRPAIGR